MQRKLGEKELELEAQDKKLKYLETFNYSGEKDLSQLREEYNLLIAKLKDEEHNLEIARVRFQRFIFIGTTFKSGSGLRKCK